MSNRKYFFGLIFIFMLVAGCKSENKGVSQMPLISKDLGVGPWQVVTYDDKKIYHETLALDGRSVTTRSESVYINNSSQFVYRDGTPILTYDGKYIYWNKDGWVINRHLQIVREDQVFVVEGKPMPVRTAMKLRDYHKGSRAVTLAGTDIGE